MKTLVSSFGVSLRDTSHTFPDFTVWHEVSAKRGSIRRRNFPIDLVPFSEDFDGGGKGFDRHGLALVSFALEVCGDTRHDHS